MPLYSQKFEVLFERESELLHVLKHTIEDSVLFVSSALPSHMSNHYVSEFEPLPDEGTTQGEASLYSSNHLILPQWEHCSAAPLLRIRRNEEI